MKKLDVKQRRSRLCERTLIQRTVAIFYLLLWMFSPASAQENVHVDDRDYIEALFLGTGSLVDPADPYNGCLGRGFTKWKDGSHIEIIYSMTSMGKGHLKDLINEAKRVDQISAGRISANVKVTQNPRPQPQQGQITVYSVDNPKKTRECPHEYGCAIATWEDKDNPNQIVAGKYVVGNYYDSGKPFDRISAQTLHDVIGHLVFGLCHVNGEPMLSQDEPIPLSLMGAGKNFYSENMPHLLTEHDTRLIQRVYSTGLDIGSTRTDFVKKGLVH